MADTETQNMGLGKLGDASLTFKRKFRWTFRVENVCGGLTLEDSYVKLASRPNLSIDETEINRLHGKGFLPGKGTWETITVTYYDVATLDNKVLWTWLASVYNFTDPVKLQMGSKRSDYAGTGVLKLFDGCGQIIEEWTLTDLWPQAIKFGDLDYSSSEELNIELTLRFSQVAYKSYCPEFDIKPCCSPCGS